MAERGAVQSLWDVRVRFAGGEPAVLECAGVKDVLTKSQGSANVLNVVQATFAGLCEMKEPAEEARRRGKKLEEVQPFWARRANGQES